MSHVRKQIRDKVKTLVTGLSTTGTRVFASRVYPLDDVKLPGLCVYTESEEIDEESGKIEGVQSRWVYLVVEGYDKLTSGADDQLDTISSEVEAVIFADRLLGGLAYAVDLVGTEVEINAETEEIIGVITMNFRVQYLTQEGSPDTAL